MNDGKAAAVRGDKTNPTHCPKLRYSSRKRALGAAAWSTKNSGEDIRAYKCEQCKAWHIGHAVPRRIREATKAAGS